MCPIETKTVRRVVLVQVSVKRRNIRLRTHVDSRRRPGCFSGAIWDLEVTRIEMEERGSLEEKLKTSDAWMRWELTILGSPNDVPEAEQLSVNFNR